MRYVLKIAYDGTDYAGWQRQKNALSVQQVLEETLLSTLGVDVRVTASGRTDAGVHAAGQICHFDSEDITVPPEKMPDCLNRFLPSGIRIVEGWGADEGFDSNRSAKRKTYCYSLYASRREMPLKERFSVRVEDAPSLEKSMYWGNNLTSISIRLARKASSFVRRSFSTSSLPSIAQTLLIP